MPEIGLDVRLLLAAYFSTPKRRGFYGLNHQDTKSTKFTKGIMGLNHEDHEDHEGHEGFYGFKSQRPQRIVTVMNNKNVGEPLRPWRLGGYVLRFASPFRMCTKGLHPSANIRYSRYIRQVESARKASNSTNESKSGWSCRFMSYQDEDRTNAHGLWRGRRAERCDGIWPERSWTVMPEGYGKQRFRGWYLDFFARPA